MLKTQDLNGEWDFHFTKKKLNEIVPADISYEDKMPVPGCFDAKGKFRYLRGTGIYRRTLSCGGKIRLDVGAVGLRADLFWDKKKIGSMEKPFSKESFIFESGPQGIHELVIATENTLDKEPSSMFHPYYDFYAYGGIYRKVAVTELPEVYLDYERITPLDLKEGTVEIHLEIGGKWESLNMIELSFDDGQMISVPVTDKIVHTVQKVPSHKLWSVETPNLHRLHLRAGQDEKEIRFGMRKVGLQDGRITLNGEPVKLIGFNRHDAHPDYGYAIPAEITRNDLEMIREKGYNFIRGCHYTQSETMLSICDELGLLVWDESLGWGNSIASMTDPVFCRYQQEQTRQMVRKSINHPCIILWGFLNEASTHEPEAGKLVNSLIQTIRSEDQSRLVTFASNQIFNDLCLDSLDVVSFNAYPGWYGQQDAQQFPQEEVLDALRKIIQFASQEKYRGKGVILSEIGAAALPGDHSGLRWSEEYQAELLKTVLDEVWRDERWSGVAFWHFSDTKTYSDGRAIHRPRGFNNKGLVTEYRVPKLAWEALSRHFAELKSR